MQSYCLGFIFDALQDNVLLIQKRRPEWQVGKLNGIGGKVETGETPLEAMVRETREECDLLIQEALWQRVAQLEGKTFYAEVFTSVLTDQNSLIQSLTDEEVQWYPIHPLPDLVISNLNWLIPLARDRVLHGHIDMVRVTYLDSY
jgi:8-oxo-dGTP diphosphatase